MPSKAEQVLAALQLRLQSVPTVRVERNTAVPEAVPGAGLVVIRDGDPGEPDLPLGGFGGAYYRHSVEVELYVEEGDATSRDAGFDDLMQAVGAALEADLTLDGLAFGMTYGRPEVATEPVSGAPAIKTGTMRIVVEYEAPTPLG